MHTIGFSKTCRKKSRYPKTEHMFNSIWLSNVLFSRLINKLKLVNRQQTAVRYPSDSFHLEKNTCLLYGNICDPILLILIKTVNPFPIGSKHENDVILYSSSYFCRRREETIIKVNTFSLRAYDGISKGPEPPDPEVMNIAISIKCFITIDSIYPPLPVLDVGNKSL